MLARGKTYRTIWLNPDDPGCVQIIDQRALPHDFRVEDIRSLNDMVSAIRDMHLRGAPLIGAAAAWGFYLALFDITPKQRSDRQRWDSWAQQLISSRPTAVNLAWAVERVRDALADGQQDPLATARREAEAIVEEDVEICRSIGEHGLALVEDIAGKKQGAPVNIMTHCNAGWLATIQWGTATSAVYHANRRGVPLHVWVSETRPRNQGANLTAWELAEEGIPHTVVVDNATGHLIQRGQVDLVLVGTDRTAANGDVANKIGTYLKALAAKDNGVPFYVAVPSPSIDWEVTDGMTQIPIEERGEEEVTHAIGAREQTVNGGVERVRLTPPQSRAANPAFDVTPAGLVTGLITERGICKASTEGLLELFPEKRDG